MRDPNSRVHDGITVSLSKNETIAALTGIEFRTNVSGPYKHIDVEVLYQGSWLTLCRTDLHDDVCTTHGTLWGALATVLDKDPVGYYRDKCAYGARVDERRFAVIDSLTDG